ncbi:CD209 antigen-like isoform X1 [Haliotis rufescens]|uniref:CD209 antigen-like isoform X1 n=1 Tax=Haliotis rufescens TaxID=6454 RepID=UPI00201EA205|nr:CD209 antigen-like isoform X1 [Haliotis rufescens]
MKSIWNHSSLVTVSVVWLAYFHNGEAIEASVSPCQDGVLKLGRACYILETVPRTWKGARASCQRKSMDLLRVDTVEEHMAVTKYLKGRKELHRIWTDVKKMLGTFRHTVGSPKLSVTFWNPSEPSNTGGMEDCVEYRRLGWNDRFCNSKNRYLCEMKECLPKCTKKETTNQATAPYTTVGSPLYITTTNKAAPSTTQEVYKNTLPMTDNSSVEHGGSGIGGVDEEKVMKMMMMTSTDTTVDIHQKMSERLDRNDSYSQSQCNLTKPRAVTVTTALVVVAVVWTNVYK